MRMVLHKQLHVRFQYMTDNADYDAIPGGLSCLICFSLHQRYATITETITVTIPTINKKNLITVPVDKTLSTIIMS